MATKTEIEIIGLGNEDWTDTLVDEDEGVESVAEWERYGTIEVRIGGVTYEVGCVIGVPEHLRGTARAAGGDRVTPYLDAWFADASDYESAPGDDGSEGVAPELYADLLAALAEAAPRLWSEARE